MALKPEQIDHINVVNWFNEKYPHLEDDFHHFANERKCTFNEGRTLKRMGVKKGVLDFHLALPMGEFHGLWLELKVGKGKLSPEQAEFIRRKQSRGYVAKVAWGHEAAKEMIVSYLNEYQNNRPKMTPQNLFIGKPIC